MKLPSNREMDSQLDTTYHQMQLPVLPMGYIKFSCWPKVPHGNLQTTQAIVKTIDCFSQNDSKVLLLKITPAQLTENGKFKMVPT